MRSFHGLPTMVAILKILLNDSKFCVNIKKIAAKIGKFTEHIYDNRYGGSFEPRTIIGKKGKERWYPIYAPHIILGTNKSILDYINNGTDTSR